MRDASRDASVTIGIVAGEASGDALAATLIAAVRERHPNIRFAGIAGPKMQAAGCEVWVPLERLAVRGFSEVIAHLPELLRIRRDVRRRFVRAGVPLFIGVDSPDFNLGLARMLKRWGVRTMHFVSPSVWAWRAERLRTIGRAVDRMLVLFPFEPPLYEQAGIPVTYVGHPMAAEMAHAGTRRAARELLKIRGAAPVFALLPGSRLSEIELHAPLVLDAAAHITASRPDAQFLVPLVSRATREAFEMAIYRGSHSGLPLTLLYGHATDALRAADVALVASGTATLEAALARCPHVIFYRVSSLTARIVARKLLLPYVGLPNVLAGRFVVPELLQTDATPRNLAQAALNLFDDSLVRRRLETLFGQMGDALRADTGQVAAEALVTELAHVGIAC
ncbi:MAG TPA: lipid-A-disaccharide synthase [Casimicrobiaceae bacterium]|jgi:lipid-A-disaccharide synthase|nr:lipid-A-disaccharide synthase [Casimicrobiaceae bacterium]